MNIQSIGIEISNWVLIGLIGGIPLFGFIRKVPVFETFVDGARDGFTLVIRIFPFLLGMFVAIGMLRASGAITLLTHMFAPILNKVGMPKEVLPLALLRPLSGSAGNAAFEHIIRTFGPDSYLARLAATMSGSTETTFYVVAIYFGSVAIRRTRHAIPAGLIADLVGVIASLAICRVVFLH